MSFLRHPAGLFGLLNFAAISASTVYLRSYHVELLEEHEARMDELEGTLRGHIGLIEGALDRLEGKLGTTPQDKFPKKAEKEDNQKSK